MCEKFTCAIKITFLQASHTLTPLGGSCGDLLPPNECVGLFSYKEKPRLFHHDKEAHF